MRNRKTEHVKAESILQRDTISQTNSDTPIGIMMVQSLKRKAYRIEFKRIRYRAGLIAKHSPTNSAIKSSFKGRYIFGTNVKKKLTSMGEV